MDNKRRFVIGIGLVFLALIPLLYALVFHRGPGNFKKLRRGRDFNVILITLDTTRADRIGAYGCDRIKTPVLDGFAEKGLRFKRCVAQTPLTLPSHTTIMTGTFPPFHGVRDNGGFLVPPALETLAEVFKKTGYQTAAFIAAYVLDSRWGLIQGFDTYYDRFDVSRLERIALGAVWRPADEVIDQVLPWLDQKKAEKFFAWIHLYDPHSPYHPPPPYDKEYADDPYLGEIAFVDSQLGRIRGFLESNRLTETTYIVIAGDHGESLGQHKEDTHGFFVYQEALQVPLIFVTPFRPIQGRISPRTASLADIMPTVLEMCGLPVPAESQGRSLTGEFFRPSGDESSLIYSETYYPRFHFGWSELKSVQNERFHLIIAPDLELYDLEQDPGELNNLASSRPEVVRSLRAGEERLEAEYARNAHRGDTGKLDEDTREKLSALGYLGSFTVSTDAGGGRKLANPKDKIEVFNDLSRAQELAQVGRSEEAVTTLHRIISGEPEVVGAYFILGNVYSQQKRHAEALAQFQTALAKKPDDTFTVINIANCHVELRQYELAEALLLDYLQRGFDDSQLVFVLGNVYFRQRKLEEAIPLFRKCISINSLSASANRALASIYFLKEDLPQAESFSREAIHLNPRLDGAHFILAQILKKGGRTDEAEAEYKKEIEITPSNHQAYLQLALIYQAQGRKELESEYAEKGLKRAPESALNCFFLAKVYFDRDEKLREAVDLIHRGIELKPQRQELAAAYFLLSQIHARLGDKALAEKYARMGQEMQNGSSPRLISNERDGRLPV